MKGDGQLELSELALNFVGGLLAHAPKLPLNMVDAMRLFEESPAVREILGEELCTAYLKLRRREWSDFMHHFSEWERWNGLDV